MSAWEREAGAWARAHRACFEVEPLVEDVRGRPVQVGFTINLYARLPEGGPAAVRWVEAAEVRAELRRMLLLLASAEDGLEIQPPRTLLYRAAADMPSEIGVSARVFHGVDGAAAATRSEGRRHYGGFQRLTRMGLKERRHLRPITRRVTEKAHE